MVFKLKIELGHKHPETYNLGSYSIAPIGWRRISEKELLGDSKLTGQSFEFIEERSLVEYHPLDGGMKFGVSKDVKMFILPDATGYAVQFDTVEKKIKYYRFGCKHKFKELSQVECIAKKIEHKGLFHHVFECQKCHVITTQNSS